MSDQVTNVDIEDVLSSIRRLVAEGDRKPASASAKSSPTEETPDKLVLTPNFRVKDAGSADVSSVPKSVDVDETDVVDPLTEVEQEPATLVLRPEQSVPSSGAELEIDSTTLEATVAGLEAEVSRQPDQWEPDGSEFEMEPTWTSAGFVAASAEMVPAEAEDAEPDQKATPPAPEEQAAPEVEALEKEILAAAVVETFRPQSRSADAPKSKAAEQSTPHRWSEHVERRITPTVDDDEADYGDELTTTEIATNDEVLEQYLSHAPQVDEATLKRIVGEVLREELQGQMGERITRNVRKLVRREIHNILTTQEFQ